MFDTRRRLWWFICWIICRLSRQHVVHDFLSWFERSQLMHVFIFITQLSKTRMIVNQTWHSARCGRIKMTLRLGNDIYIVCGKSLLRRVLERIKRKLEDLKQKLQTHATLLWLQYIQMVDIPLNVHQPYANGNLGTTHPPSTFCNYKMLRMQHTWKNHVNWDNISYSDSERTDYFTIAIWNGCFVVPHDPMLEQLTV